MLVILVGLLLAACNHSNVVEKSDGTLLSWDTGYSESGAINGATKFCKKQNKRMVVIKQDTKYSGADKNTKAILGAVSLARSHRVGQPSYTDGSRHDDYRSDLIFQCK